jgi:hypothetical protein
MGRSRCLTLVLGSALFGCTGAIDSGSGKGPPDKPDPGNGQGNSGGGMTNGGSGGPGGGTLPPLEDAGGPDRSTAACKTIKPGLSPLRRLTRAEYDRTVQDLLGDDRHLAKAFPQDEIEHGFDNSAELRSVSDVLSEGYVSAAEQLSAAAVAKLDTVLGCDPAKLGEPVCLDKLLDGFGKRAWRRPLSSAERDHLKKVFSDERTTGFAEGAQAVVEVMLLSPQFLYRVESGVPVAGADYQRLSPYEMASRLSYTLWGTMPDQALFAAADAGKLGTRAEIAAQARRLIDDPRATEMVTGFAGQWLQLDKLADADKDVTVYKTYKPELLGLFQQETEAFVQNVWKADAKLSTLLTANYTFVNGPLAQFYGISGVTGPDFQKVPAEAGRRAGLLTQASLLAANAAPDQSSPVHRGVFVREQLFCNELPPPPPEVNANPPMLDPKQTTAERFAAHRADPSCASCHNLIDPIGLGFENFDGIGLWRTMEGAKPVDARGNILGTDVAGPFNGALELASKLASSKDVSSCMVTHWFRFGNGRDVASDDACTMETLSGSFARSGGSLRELLLAMVQTDAFMFRKGVAP